jgi:hypothetical protein
MIALEIHRVGAGCICPELLDLKIMFHPFRILHLNIDVISNIFGRSFQPVLHLLTFLGSKLPLAAQYFNHSGQFSGAGQHAFFRSLPCIG